MSVSDAAHSISGHSRVLPTAARKRNFCQTQFQKCVAQCKKGSASDRERGKAAAPQPTMLWRSQIRGFEPWIETKDLNPGRRYSFAKTAEANKIMFTKAMNATVT